MGIVCTRLMGGNVSIFVHLPFVYCHSVCYIRIRKYRFSFYGNRFCNGRKLWSNFPVTSMPLFLPSKAVIFVIDLQLQLASSLVLYVFSNSCLCVLWIAFSLYKCESSCFSSTTLYSGQLLLLPFDPSCQLSFSPLQYYYGDGTCGYVLDSTMLHFTNCARQLIIGGENLIPSINLIDFETFKMRTHCRIGWICSLFLRFFFLLLFRFCCRRFSLLRCTHRHNAKALQNHLG